MPDIGIRELKTHASEIIRQVKEEGRRYIITRRGHPIAAIVPVESASVDADLESRNLAWEELVQLGQQIGQEWKSPKSSTDILSEIRR